MDDIGNTESEHCKQRRKIWISIIRTEQRMRKEKKLLLSEGLGLIFRSVIPPDITKTYIAKYVWWALPISHKTLHASYSEYENDLCHRCISAARLEQGLHMI